MQSHSILSSFLLSAFSQIGSRILRFWYVGWIVKTLGASSWGDIAFAVTSLSFISILLEAGKTSNSSVWKVDSIEGDSEAFQQLVWVRLAWTLPIFFLLHAVLFLFPFPGSLAIQIYSVWLLLRPFTLDWLLVRRHRSGLPQLFQFLRNAMLLTLVFIYRPNSVSTLLVLELSLEFLVAIVTLFLFRHEYRKIPPFSLKQGWGSFLISSPFLIASIFSLLHQNGDVFLIRIWHGSESVGLYDFVYKIMLFVFYAGGGLSLALRTRLASMLDNSTVDKTLMYAIQRILSLLSLFYLLFVWYISFPVLNHFLPQYAAEAVILLKLVSFYIPFAFFNIPIVEWLVVRRSSKEFAKLALVMGSANILLNLIAIPYWGLIGATCTTVLVEFGASYYLWKQAKLNGMYITKNRHFYFPVIMTIIVVLLSPPEANSLSLFVIASIGVILLSLLFGQLQRADLKVLSAKE